MKHASTSVRVMNPRIIDLFAGPGGLDVAAHWLGVPVTGIEWDPNACATRRAAGLDTHEGDVREFGPHLFPDANVLAGGPPCQTYTVAGTGAGRMALERVLRLVKSMSAGEDVQDHIASFDDERTGLVLEPLRWALGAYRDGRPYEAVVLEQVPAVLPVWEAMGEALEGLGYTVAVGVLRTEEFGVPQTRRRAILLARYGSDVRLPAATHRSYRKGAVREQDCSDLLPWNTMGDALSSTRGYEFSVVSNYGTGGDPRARGRRSSDEPAFTVTGKVSRNRLIGGDGAEINRFTMAEAGRLQTFPMNFPWSGSDISQQIGNAIPPRLGAHILAAALGMSDVINELFLREVMDGNWFESLVHRDAGDGKDGSVFLEHA